MKLLLFLLLAVASWAAPQKFFIVSPESFLSEQHGGEQRNRTLIPISLFSANSNVGVPLLGQPLSPHTKETILPLQSLVKPKAATSFIESSKLSRKNEDKTEKKQPSFDEILNAMFIKKPIELLKPIIPVPVEQRAISPLSGSNIGVSLFQNIGEQELGMFLKLPSKEMEKLSKKPTQLEKHKNLSKLRKTISKTGENETNSNKDTHTEIVQEAFAPTIVLPDLIVESPSSKDSVSQSTKEVTNATINISESSVVGEDIVSTSEVPTQITTTPKIDSFQTPQNDAAEIHSKPLEKSVDEIMEVLLSLNNNLSQNSELHMTTENTIEADLTAVTPLQEATTESSKQETAEARTEFPIVRALITEPQSNNDDATEVITSVPQELGHFQSEELTTHLPVSEISSELPAPLVEEMISNQPLLNKISTTILPFEDNFISDTTLNLVEESTKSAEESTIRLLELHKESLITESQSNNDDATEVITSVPQELGHFPFEELTTHLSVSEISNELPAPLVEEMISNQPLLNEVSTTILPFEENFISDTTLSLVEESTKPAEESTIRLLELHKENITTEVLFELPLVPEFQAEIVTPDLPAQTELSTLVSTETSTFEEENKTSKPVVSELNQNESSQTRSSSDSEITTDKIDSKFLTLLEEKDITTSRTTEDQKILTEEAITKLPVNGETINDLTNTEFLNLLEKEILDSHITEALLDQVIQEERLSTEFQLQENIADLSKKEDLTSLDEKITTELSITEIPQNEEIHTENVITELPIQNKATTDLITLLEGHETLESMGHTEIIIIPDSPMQDKLTKMLIPIPVSALEVDNSATENPELILAEESATENLLPKETIFSHVDLEKVITTEIPIENTFNDGKVETDSPTVVGIEDIETTTEFHIEDKIDKEVKIITDEEQVEVSTVNLLLTDKNETQSISIESPFLEKAIKEEDTVLTEKSLGKSLVSDSVSNDEHTEATTILTKAETSTKNADNGVPIVKEANSDIIGEDKISNTEKVITEENITEHVTESPSIETTFEMQSTPINSLTVSQAEEKVSVKPSVEETTALPFTEVLGELITEADRFVEETTDTITTISTNDKLDLPIVEITTELSPEMNSESTSLSNKLSESTVVSVGLFISEQSALQNKAFLTITEAPFAVENSQIMQEESSNKVTEIKSHAQHDGVFTADISLNATEAHLEAEDKAQELHNQPSSKIINDKPSIQNDDASKANASNILIQEEPATNEFSEEPESFDSSLVGKTVFTIIPNNPIHENETPSTNETMVEVLSEAVANAPSTLENISQTIVGGKTDDTTVNKIHHENILSNSTIVANNSTTESKSLGPQILTDTSNVNTNRLLTDEEIALLLTPVPKVASTQLGLKQNLGKTLTINSKLHRNLLRTNLAAKHFGFKTPSSVKLMPKQISFKMHGAFVDPKTLVAPQFRNFIYENDAPEVIAAKIAFFRVQDGLTSLNNQP